MKDPQSTRAFDEALRIFETKQTAYWLYDLWDNSPHFTSTNSFQKNPFRKAWKHNAFNKEKALVASGAFSISLKALQSNKVRLNPPIIVDGLYQLPLPAGVSVHWSSHPGEHQAEKYLEDKCPPSLHPTIPCTGGKTWPSLYSIDSRHCTNYNCSVPPFVATRQKRRSSEDWRWRRSPKFCKEAESLESGIIYLQNLQNISTNTMI